MIGGKAEFTIAQTRAVCILAAASIFVLGIVWYGYCAANLPGYFGVDGHINNAATRYVAEHRKIPVLRADDPEIVFTSLGTTRLSRPPFSIIVSAAAYEITTRTAIPERLRLRLGSVLLGSLTLVVAYIGLLLASRYWGLALAGTLLIGGLPRFTVLSSTNNDDIGAIFAATLLFTSLIWLHRGEFRTTKVYLLAAAIGITFLAKFTAWLLLPWSILLSVPIIFAETKKLLRRLPVLCLVTILFGAWWPISNMVNYGWKDPTALRHAEHIQLIREGGTPNSRGYWSQGMTTSQILKNHDQFISTSLKSAVGYQPLIEFEAHQSLYWLYAAIAVCSLGMAILSLREPWVAENRLRIIAFAIILTELLFYTHHNLKRDIQLDARYVLPGLMPFIFLFVSIFESSHWSKTLLKPGLNFIKPNTTLAILTISISVILMVINWQASILHHISD